MRIRWRGLELPSRLERDESLSSDVYGKFIVEPFERGFGTTVGNSLRRILLSSLNGAAVYAVKIARAPHEFTTLPGVVEDVADIILNIKAIVIEMEGDESQTRSLRLSRSTAGEIFAGDFEAETGVRVVNPQLKIATLSEDVPFEIEMRAKTGRGYATAEENAGPEQEIGVIPIDSIFSPVMRVRYRTEDTRVGQLTNYDRLILEVWTRGSIKPEDAVVEAAKILRKHLNPFIQYHELGSEVVVEAPTVTVPANEVDDELKAKLARSVSEMQLSVRAANCLESARIRTVGELVRKTEADMLRVRSFGKTSLREVRHKLAEWGLSLGMTFSEAGDANRSGSGDSAVSRSDMGSGGGALGGETHGDDHMADDTDAAADHGATDESDSSVSVYGDRGSMES